MQNIEDICKKDRQWRGYALKLCKCKTVADDLVQQMYVNLMEVNKPIKEWYVIATIRNIYFNELKTNENKNTCYLEETNLTNIQNTNYIEDDIIREEIKKELIYNISNLPFKKEKAINLFYYKDYSYREIAEELNDKIGNVSKILYDSKNKLKR